MQGFFREGAATDPRMDSKTQTRQQAQIQDCDQGAGQRAKILLRLTHISHQYCESGFCSSGINVERTKVSKYLCLVH